jgi:hypothetical protein
MNRQEKSFFLVVVGVQRGPSRWLITRANMEAILEYNAVAAKETETREVLAVAVSAIIFSVFMFVQRIKAVTMQLEALGREIETVLQGIHTRSQADGQLMP